MALFKFVVSNAGRTVQVEKDQAETYIIGKKIGDTISGDFLGLGGYELLITGGHDKDGIAMIKDVEGIGKRGMLMKKGLGFSARLRRKKKLTKPKDGLRKRKVGRGNTISPDVVQINCKIVKSGSQSFDEVFPKKEKQEKKEE